MQHLYISYPRQDYDLTHRLVDDLQAAGYTVFVDAVNEIGSLAWTAETRRAIRSCGAMIMILSLAKRRRVGIRHEGVLARRRHKPTYVLARTPGPLPRYLSDATVVDFSGEYESALHHLLTVLPSVTSLREEPISPRTYLAPPPPTRIVPQWLVWLAAVLIVSLLLGIVLGVIPV